MKRQVSIFIETALAQTELEFSRLELFNDEKIKFEINDTYDNIDKACKSKLDLFRKSTLEKELC